MGPELLVAILFAALQHREALTEAGMAFLSSIRSLLDEDEISPERLREIGVTAAANGIDLRETVLERLQPGGSWHGRMSPEELELFAAAVAAARSRVAGGRGAWLAPVLLGLALLAAPGAWAACPAPDTSDPYDATSGSIRWCTPEKDSAGGALDPGELATCAVSVSIPGTPATSVPITAPAPGTVFTTGFPAARGDGTVSLVCANSRGEAGVALVRAARFPLGKPGSPSLVVQ